MPGIDLDRKWDAYGLTTAHILYGMPDHPSLLQSYVWQDYDLAPQFPELRRFLDFWQRELEGPLRSVTVAPQAPDPERRVPRGDDGTPPALTDRRSAWSLKAALSRRRPCDG